MICDRCHCQFLVAGELGSMICGDCKADDEEVEGDE